MGGASLPLNAWQGGLNFTYFVGPGPVQVHMKLEVNYTVTPIWNVLGMIEGSEEPDRYVLLGCHRDAWTFGAGDPISGHSVLLEIARVFSELRSQGWKPRRTIVIASWDAEEYALIGRKAGLG
jgi:N-acetylated-alpha-linked acidic dipeptidase